MAGCNCHPSNSEKKRNLRPVSCWILNTVFLEEIYVPGLPFCVNIYQLITGRCLSHSFYIENKPFRGLGRPLGLQKFEAHRISRQLAYEYGKVFSSTHRSPLTLTRYPWYSFLLQIESNAGTMTVSGMEPATFRSASVNYTTAYLHSFYITSLILQYLSFCHQGQTQNFQILEVTGDLYNAMSNRQMRESSTDYGLGTRCIWVTSFTTPLIYPTPILPHRAGLNVFFSRQHF